MLKGLRGSSVQLWDSYRTQSVVVDYSAREIQAGYLLRYFVPYTLAINKLLIDSNFLFAGESVSSCFVGAGPAPEAIGFLSFLATHNKSVTKANINLIDRTADQWDFSRGITCEASVTDIVAPEISLLWKSFALDLTKKHSVAGKLDILVFQNCLNEILHSGFNLESLKTWSDSVKPGGAIAFIDRTGYSLVSDFLVSAVTFLKENGYAEIAAHTAASIDIKPCSRAIPKTVLENLLHYPPVSWPCGSEPYGLRLASEVKYVAYLLVKPA